MTNNGKNTLQKMQSEIRKTSDAKGAQEVKQREEKIAKGEPAGKTTTFAEEVHLVALLKILEDGITMSRIAHYFPHRNLMSVKSTVEPKQEKMGKAFLDSDTWYRDLSDNELALAEEVLEGFSAKAFREDYEAHLTDLTNDPIESGFDDDSEEEGDIDLA